MIKFVEGVGERLNKIGDEDEETIEKYRGVLNLAAQKMIEKSNFLAAASRTILPEDVVPGADERAKMAMEEIPRIKAFLERLYGTSEARAHARAEKKMELERLAADATRPGVSTGMEDDSEQSAGAGSARFQHQSRPGACRR